MGAMYSAHVTMALLAEGVPDASPRVALPGLNFEYCDTFSARCMLDARIIHIKLHPCSTQALVVLR